MHDTPLSEEGVDDSLKGDTVVGDRGIFDVQVLYLVLHDVLEYLFYPFYVKYFVIYDIFPTSISAEYSSFR